MSLAYVGTTSSPDVVAHARQISERFLGVELRPFTYDSERFEALKGEGREPPPAPTPAELEAAEILRERPLRSLAVAIKASGGLLLRDVSKQLAPELRDRGSEFVDALKTAKLVDSEIVVICLKTQAQITRAPNKEVLRELSGKGLRCACGRPLEQERTEEALAITELGRSILDKARWLTLLLLKELGSLGVDRESILIEQQVAGDEIDCVANVSGELVLFELKDKEFNLGNAYSFGAKIGIIRPKHPVVVSTEHVGNDAKEHFRRAHMARSNETRFIESTDENPVTYIEGVEQLEIGVQNLVSSIYRADAVALISQVLPLAALDASAVLRAVDPHYGTTGVPGD